MAQFDVYENPLPAARKTTPYVVVLQSDMTSVLDTTIVAPLARKGDPGANSKLQRAVLVGNEPLVLLFQAIGPVRLKDLRKPVARLPEVRDHMMQAIDLLFLGF